MHISIDASRAGRPRPTGTEAYSRNLLRELVPLARAHRLDLYYDRPPAEPLGAPHATERVVRLPRLWTHARLSLELLRRRPDVLFVPSHVVPLVHPCPTVVTVHDLGYLRYRLAYRPAAWIYLLLSTLWSARVATRVIADSEATRRDLVRHARVDPDRVDVVPLGVDARFGRPPLGADARPDSPPRAGEGEYFLFVGTRQPRKNLPRLLRAYAAARRRAPMPELRVVGAGGGPTYAGRDLALPSGARLLGYVPDDRLPALYAGASAVLLPSLYEGFGLPLLEGMASGVAVLGGANSSMPEIVGDAGLLVDAEDERAIEDALVRLATDPALRADLGARGLARARQFTWRRTAEATLAVLERAARSA
jgi:glycosyltransferase involved in cell wall biosynthesis